MRNTPTNVILRALFKLLTYVLVGTGHTKTLVSWIIDRPPGIEGLPFHEIYSVLRWKGYMLARMLEALYLWDTEESLDAAIDYYTQISIKRMHDLNWRHIPMVPGFVTLKGYIIERSKLSPESYENFYKTVSQDWSLGKQHLETTETYYSLFHPTHRTADRMILLLQRVERDSGHTLRKGTPIRGNRVAQQKFLFRLGYEAIRILKREGRYEEARWVFDTVTKVWGRDSGFVDGVGRN